MSAYQECQPILTDAPAYQKHLLYIPTVVFQAKKISVTFSKYLLWKCLRIHQIRGENEEQQIKLT